MKKLLLVFTSTMFCIVVFAQTNQNPQEKSADSVSQATLTPLSTAIDFDITFTDGTTANLFNTCNAGNSVVLDFFFTTCYYCQIYANKIEQAYIAHGSGTWNIKFWGIDYDDDNAAVIKYKTSFALQTQTLAPVAQKVADTT